MFSDRKVERVAKSHWFMRFPALTNVKALTYDSLWLRLLTYQYLSEASCNLSK